MDINYKQSQFELFPAALVNTPETHRPRFFIASLTFSLENLITIGIVGIMAVVLFFSLGVERGKRMMTANADDLQNHGITAQKVSVLIQSAPSSPMKVQEAVSVKESNDAKGLKEKAATETDKIKELKKTPSGAGEILSNPFTIQVASFKTKEYAQKEATDLRKKGFDIFVVSKGNYSIVCVGKFSNKNDAQPQLTKLKKMYKDCLVRRM